MSSQGPRREQGYENFGSDIDHELSVSEFRLEKLVPKIGNFLGRKQFSVESYHLDATTHGHDVAIGRIDHLNGNLQHLVFDHSQEVKLFQIGEIFLVMIVLEVVTSIPLLNPPSVPEAGARKPRCPAFPPIECRGRGIFF